MLHGCQVLPTARSPARGRPTAPWTRIALLVAPLALCGCAQYRWGTDSLYRRDITTVRVDILGNDTYRRDLGERLTEAVAKEIEARTPYKVTTSPFADSVLTGRVVTDHKRILVESTTDEGRELEVGFLIEVAWIDRTGDLLSQTALPVPSIVTIENSARLVPEVGQSVVVAQQRAIQRLARQIVDLMELDWQEPLPALPGAMPGGVPGTVPGTAPGPSPAARPGGVPTPAPQPLPPPAGFP
jgi:hypothetical protein